jgi:hydroxyethylthiazole kinase-like uncharacterized protein yjeF
VSFEGVEDWLLVDAEGMRLRDRHTIETLAVPAALLMESAGRSVAGEALVLGAAARGVFVVCGSGNNGGDGLVAARHLHLLGVRTRVALLGDGERLSGDAAANLLRARAAGVAFASAEAAPRSGEVVVDAIFGTGLTRAVEGAAAEAIARIDRGRREAGCRVLSVDLPSGLCADTGQPLGACVAADVSVTLGHPKLGLALEPGRSLAGRIRVARIGIADTAPGAPAGATLWTRAGAARRLPHRASDGHKGSFGHVLVIAGSEGRAGAAALAAHGAGRAGAGLVTIACPASLSDILQLKCTEAMTAPVPETRRRALSIRAEKDLRDLAAARDVVALGPGIGGDPETVALVRALAPILERPLVLDADGLNAIAADPTLLKARRHATIVTPHPGEAARLLGLRGQEINADRVGMARALCARTGAVVVLKGAATVTAAPDGRVAVNPTGGPLLGTGGSGDVLTGVIAGFLAQGMAPFEAGALGAFVHGLAADGLADRNGPAGALAEDVAAEIPVAMGQLRRDRSQTMGGRRETADADARGLSLSFPEP